MVVGPKSDNRTGDSNIAVPRLTSHQLSESGYGSSESSENESKRRRASLLSKISTHHDKYPIKLPETTRQETERTLSRQSNRWDDHNARKAQRQQLVSNADPFLIYKNIKSKTQKIEMKMTLTEESKRKSVVHSMNVRDRSKLNFTHSPEYSKQNYFVSRSELSTAISRHVPAASKPESSMNEYEDDWESDYSEDWEPDCSNDKKSKEAIKTKPIEIQVDTQREPILENNLGKLVPAYSNAFEPDFCRQRQAAIDNIDYRNVVKSWKAKTLQDLITMIRQFSSGKSSIDKAWIVFYWISQNIQYDVDSYFSGNIRHQTSNDVFANRKGVCDAFGTIFEALCQGVELECKKISGYAKGHGFSLSQSSFTKANHAWNVVRIHKHWYLVDSTWGTGHLDENNRNKQELDPFYFLIPPEQLIYSHFPENEQWQLLAKPISMENFISLPKVYSNFFKFNLEIVDPIFSNTARFDLKTGIAEVLVRAPADTAFSSAIDRAKSRLNEACSFVHYDTDRQLWQFLFAPRHSGQHTLTIFVKNSKKLPDDRENDGSYHCAIELGLQIPVDFVRTRTFPTTYGLFAQLKCQIFEPLHDQLKPGSKVTIHCRVPGVYSARLMLDNQWLSEDIIKNGIFKRECTVPKQKITMYVKLYNKRNDSHYDGLFQYAIEP